MTRISDLGTPCLLLERAKLERNFTRLAEAARAAGVRLRPHLKTVKSVDLVRHVMPDLSAPITVSTLLEAEVFAKAGYKDILYAVGIVPQKLDRCAKLIAQGVRLTLILDSECQAEAVAKAAEAHGLPLRAMIELDCDGHRSGLAPDDAEALIAIAKPLQRLGLFAGLITHCGSSYGARTDGEIREWSIRERDAALTAAAHLRHAGIEVPCLSIGSTPTAFAAIPLDGITELRAGVSLFFDLVQSGVGVCRPEEIAISVLTTVIGQTKSTGRIIIDAGWMALSRDRGTSAQPIDQKYGLVCREDGTILPDLLVIDTNQEHGVIGLRPGSTDQMPELAPGTLLRILPNHACATAAQHQSYHVIGDKPDVVEANWPRFNGW